jgi:hypothetical protein
LIFSRVGPAWATTDEAEVEAMMTAAVVAATSCVVAAVVLPSVRVGRSRLAAVPTYLWAADI